MLKFDPSDPFPLIDRKTVPASEEQKHSAEADAWLGLDVERIEAALQGAPRTRDQEFWIGLPPASLQTPFTELREILVRLAPPTGSIVVDLGAGYGRMGYVIASHFPGVRFIGYEFVEERIRTARGRIDLRQADLSSPSFTPEAADFYFLYDYGSRQAIDKTLRDLKTLASSRPLTVVGRGRASRDAIERENPWLSQVVPPEHYPHYSIYRTRLAQLPR